MSRRGAAGARLRIDGILLLDKPAGASSNQVLQKVRRLLGADKAGHTGALDPLATGLLPLCFGEATKIAGLLLGSDKAYRVEARLGQTTDTDDADGRVLVERPVPELDAARLVPHLEALCGRIRQRPPAYSALKRDGVPAYRRARAGQTVELAPREVVVHGIRLLEVDAARLVLEVECGSGTYVRSLIRDLGEALGCGAHVTALRRLWVEPFRHPRMWTLDALEGMDVEHRRRCLLPLEAGLRHLPALAVDAPAAQRLRQGQRLRWPAATTGEYILWLEGKAIGRARVDEAGVLRPERLFADGQMEVGEGDGKGAEGRADP